jgi:hypothetical protein
MKGFVACVRAFLLQTTNSVFAMARATNSHLVGGVHIIRKQRCNDVVFMRITLLNGKLGIFSLYAVSVGAAELAGRVIGIAVEEGAPVFVVPPPPPVFF